MPEKHTEDDAARTSDRARRVLNVRRRRDEAAPAPAPRRRTLRVWVASFVIVTAASMLALGAYVVLQHGFPWAPAPASAAQTGAPAQ
ncbi:MAG: hypothetical protein GC206_06875 [Alphaproteobacteria bacterium]|nr:hypothetical protein [Alphaproteobacteria bacterium]